MEKTLGTCGAEAYDIGMTTRRSVLTMVLAASAGAAGRVFAWRSPSRQIECAPQPEIYLPPWQPPDRGRALSIQEEITLTNGRLGLRQDAADCQICRIGHRG